MLPTDTLFAATAWRWDRWDSNDDEGSRDRWGEGINLSLINQHYNMRLKPYLTYTAYHSEGDSYWQNTARAGVRGPLSDYTDLDANVGYYWHGEGAADEPSVHEPLWRVSITNELNELTTQRLTYSRSVGSDGEVTNTTLEYDLHRTLGPRLEGVLYASWTERDESSSGWYADGNDETRYNAGAGLFWDASSRLTVTLQGFLTAVQEQDTDQDYEEYRVRLGADYDFTDTLSLWLSYEYTIRDDETPDESFRENLVRMRLTKTW
jgi:opacity protein-like surface antigen